MTPNLEGELFGAMPASERELHLAVGVAIHRWQSVEHQLEVVFSSAADLAPIEVRAMFEPIHSWKTKVDLTDVVVRTALEDDAGWQQKWLEIREFLMELAGDRNFMAHNGLVTHWTDEGLPIPKIGIDNRRHPALDAAAVAELALDFHQAYVVLLYVDSCARNGRSSRDKHRELRIRRRPARSERVAAARRADIAKAKAARRRRTTTDDDRETAAVMASASHAERPADVHDWLKDMARRARMRPSNYRCEQPD